jgi:hypothetical protein
MQSFSGFHGAGSIMKTLKDCSLLRRQNVLTGSALHSMGHCFPDGSSRRNNWLASDVSCASSFVASFALNTGNDAALLYAFFVI